MNNRSSVKKIQLSAEMIANALIICDHRCNRKNFIFILSGLMINKKQKPKKRRKTNRPTQK